MYIIIVITRIFNFYNGICISLFDKRINEQELTKGTIMEYTKILEERSVQSTDEFFSAVLKNELKDIENLDFMHRLTVISGIISGKFKSRLNENDKLVMALANGMTFDDFVRKSKSHSISEEQHLNTITKIFDEYFGHFDNLFEFYTEYGRKKITKDLKVDFSDKEIKILVKFANFLVAFNNFFSLEEISMESYELIINAMTGVGCYVMLPEIITSVSYTEYNKNFVYHLVIEALKNSPKDLYIPLLVNFCESTDWKYHSINAKLFTELKKSKTPLFDRNDILKDAELVDRKNEGEELIPVYFVLNKDRCEKDELPFKCYKSFTDAIMSVYNRIKLEARGLKELYEKYGEEIVEFPLWNSMECEFQDTLEEILHFLIIRLMVDVHSISGSFSNESKIIESDTYNFTINDDFYIVKPSLETYQHAFNQIYVGKYNLSMLKRLANDENDKLLESYFDVMDYEEDSATPLPDEAMLFHDAQIQNEDASDDSVEVEKLNQMIKKLMKEKRDYEELNKKQQENIHNLEISLNKSKENSENRVLNLEEKYKHKSNEAYELQEKNKVLHEKLSNKSLSNESVNGAVLLHGTEQDIWDGETSAFIRSALEIALKSAPEGSRRYDVLKGVLESSYGNEENKLKKKSEVIKKAVKGFRDLSEIKDDLSEEGFVVEKGESGHAKIKYPNDDRYIITCASTPSDVRAGDNVAQLIIKKFL